MTACAWAAHSPMPCRKGRASGTLGAAAGGAVRTGSPGTGCTGGAPPGWSPARAATRTWRQTRPASPCLRHIITERVKRQPACTPQQDPPVFQQDALLVAPAEGLLCIYNPRLTRGLHQAGGDAELAVRARHRQRRDVPMYLSRLLLPASMSPCTQLNPQRTQQCSHMALCASVWA